MKPQGRLVVSIVSGCAANILLTFAIALLTRPVTQYPGGSAQLIRQTTKVLDSSKSIYWSERTGVGHVIVELCDTQSVSPMVLKRRPAHNLTPRDNSISRIGALPRWIRLGSKPPVGAVTLVATFGFPIPWLSYQQQGITWASPGQPVDAFEMLLGTTRVKLPLAVSPRNAIASTAVYGVVFYAISIAYVMTTRRRRHTRKLCVKCTYPLTSGELCCPECGTIAST